MMLQFFKFLRSNSKLLCRPGHAGALNYFHASLPAVLLIYIAVLCLYLLCISIVANVATYVPVRTVHQQPFKS